MGRTIVTSNGAPNISYFPFTGEGGLGVWPLRTFSSEYSWEKREGGVGKEETEVSSGAGPEPVAMVAATGRIGWKV